MNQTSQYLFRLKFSMLSHIILGLFFSFCIFHQTSATLNSKDFILFTPPKCGTHLICNVLSYMLGRAPLITDQLGDPKDIFQFVEAAKNKNYFVVSHSFTSEMLNDLICRGYKVIFILRDPRDQLVSMMYWMKKGYWNEFKASKISEVNFQIEELITGALFGWKCYEGCIGARLKLIQTFDSDQKYITHFESLVGAKGGGDANIQIEEIQKIAQFLDVPISTNFAHEVAIHSFGNTWSFREGKIGSWKTHFLPYQIIYYKALYSNLLIDFGYEQDSEW